MRGTFSSGKPSEGRAEPGDEGRHTGIDGRLERLRSRANAWLHLSLQDRVDYVQGCMDRTLDVAPRQVAAAMEAKRLLPGTAQEGEEWLAGPGCQLRVMRLVRETLERLRDQGAVGLQPDRIRIRADGRGVLPVFPGSAIDRVLFTGYTAEVWTPPGRTPEQIVDGCARAYLDPPSAGRIALVLAAGNVASIGPLDAVHKLFIERQVVMLKMNPVNDYLGPFIEEVFADLVRDGYVAVVYGAADVGDYLCRHDEVDEIHITGSAKTHDAIVFGTGSEGESRRAAGRPRLTKRITSELGNVSPVVIVPGTWSAADLRRQAENVATQMTQNGGFNCNAATVLVTHEGWPQRGAFLDGLRSVLGALGARCAYYPGAEDRFDRFVRSHPAAEMFGDRGDGHLPAALLPGIDPARTDHLVFREESFCTVTAEIGLPGADVADFLDRAVVFCNDVLYGTLNAGLIVDPATERRLGSGFLDRVAALRYGTVAINHWAALAFMLGTTTWGAYPGHPLNDIQSGRGIVHNAFMVDDPERSVVRGPFRPLVKPPWYVTHPHGHEIGPLIAALEHAPAWSKLPRLLRYALVR